MIHFHHLLRLYFPWKYTHLAYMWSQALTRINRLFWYVFPSKNTYLNSYLDIMLTSRNAENWHACLVTEWSLHVKWIGHFIGINEFISNIEFWLFKENKSRTVWLILEKNSMANAYWSIVASFPIEARFISANGCLWSIYVNDFVHVAATFWHNR